MARYWQARRTGIDVKSGGDITFAAGSTLDVSAGTLSAGAYSPTTLAVGGGHGSSGASISAAGLYEGDGGITTAGVLKAGTHDAEEFSVTTGVVTCVSLTIGAGAGTITDTVATLTLTETNISLAGAVSANTLAVAGGHGSSGVSIDAAGLIEADGGITTAGVLKAGTHDAEELSVTAGVVTCVSLTIGAGAGTISDAVATLTLTETNIALVGAATATSMAVTNALSCGDLTVGAGAGTITDAVATLTLTETNIALVGATAVTGALTVSTTLGVTGAATVDSLVIGVGAGTISDAVATMTLTETNISLAGATDCVGDFSVATTMFTVDNATGNTVLLGTLDAGTADHFQVSANGILTLNHDGTDITIDGHTTDGTLAIAGGPVQITGDGTNPDLILHGAGSLTPVAWAAVGAYVADGGTYAFIADQKALRVNVEGTVYRIPLWADA